ncbi:hypothetical protein [Pedobacter antarcticus]|uniref:hypothetical protein n=1 Tax=Pedobacter antarcticus TaxID=34086 RepID=UPI000883FF75|nr:hypothetical protein [Pedobacter antarcticus]SDM39798.1 hypothetical protein SAMN04488084_106146 [Pedobacter antarcticus]
MNPIEVLTRNNVTNGQINGAQAIAIAKTADELLKEAADLLKECSSNVGMTTNGKITEFTAKISQTKFNPAAFYYNREPEGQ